MTKKTKFRCPGCERVIGVPAVHQGRKVACPTCSTVFRAGPKQPEPTEDVIQATLVPEKTSPAPEPDLFADTSFASAPLASSTRPKAKPNQGLSRRQALERGRKHAKKTREEMSETDARVQSAGVFLIILPVVASVLPLFGLQLRRLAKAGEYAPLSAIVLGLIGAGCIGYARRRQGDAPLLGGAAAAFVLFTGMSGFILLRAIAPAEEGVAQRDVFENHNPVHASKHPGVSTNSAQAKAKAAKTTPEERARNAKESKERMKAAAERGRLRREETEKRMRETAERQKRSREESERKSQEIRERNNQRATEELRPGGQANGNTNSRSPFNPDSPADNGLTDSRADNPASDENPFADGVVPTNKPAFLESVPQDFGNASKRTEVHRRWGSGNMSFAEFRRTKKLRSGLKLGQIVGQDQIAGKLFFYPKPIRGVEVIKIGSVEFVPITSRETPSDDAVLEDDNGGIQLVGFNLAFEGDNIVGIQGLFSAGDGATKQTTSHWLGTETDDVQQSSTTKSVYGFVCYTKGFDMTGFALIYK